MEKGVYLFLADGRLLVRPDDGRWHEADAEERDQVRFLWLFHRGMWARWGRRD